MYSLLSLLLLVSLGMVQAVQNEEWLTLSEVDQYQVKPRKIRGSWAVRDDPVAEECSECSTEARVVLDRTTQFLYFKYYSKNETIINPFELGGIKTCEDVDRVNDCYTKCFETLPGDAERPTEYLYISNLKTKYCEDPQSARHPSCRLAPILGCDMKHRKSLCGGTYEAYKKCVKDTLYYAGQVCTGVCTPARRYHKTMLYQWDSHCELRKAPQSQCEQRISYTCFNQIKDTDTNYGYFDSMDKVPEMANDLTHTCEILESPYECINETVYGFYDYYGFNITYPCAPVSETVVQVTKKWEDIIAPFCGSNRDPTATTIEEACPPPPATDTPPVIQMRTRPPTTTTTLPPWKIFRPTKGKCRPGTEDKVGDCDDSLQCGDDTHCAPHGSKSKCCGQCCTIPLVRRAGGSGCPDYWPCLDGELLASYCIDDVDCPENSQCCTTHCVRQCTTTQPSGKSIYEYFLQFIHYFLPAEQL